MSMALLNKGEPMGEKQVVKNAEAPLLDLKARLASIDRLPIMPEMTRKIFSISMNQNAGVKDLVKVVELDPSLSAQIMCYARSPFFNYRGKIDSIDVAISRVLGYTTALNLALGATASKPFKIPRNIPLGLDAYWRGAVFNAALTQALSCSLPAEIRPPAGLAYLAGLLHNFGYLLMGHLFKQEFLILNKYVACTPDRDIVDIEHEVLGVGHGEIGALLMANWNLPDEVVVAAREHHNKEYYGPHAVYANLVQLSSYLLKKQGIGDAPDEDIPESLLNSLELGEYQAITIAEQVLGDCDELKQMARKLSH